MIRARGFTVIDLLVALAAVFVLVVIAVWLFRPYRGREPARKSMCDNNLGTLMKNCHLYADAYTNLGRFPLYNENHNRNGHKALAKLFGQYVKDHRIYSCVSKPTKTAVLTRYVEPDESALQVGYTNYGYDPGHTPAHATAGVIADRGTLHQTNHKNSTNHGEDGPGQNVVTGAGAVEWWDAADARATKDANGFATTDDIFADDLDLEKFPEELETNIIQ